ncbi:hypothetical protein [Aquabacterium sp. OR-4]|uniref:hypothetical protein n=1 Tax=Aquabacterium sp. OR-4 TaxID=2978127 RepID=UPI0021B39BA8|nr:hypothetical protein [Aquabacterium sp. OR-4]MDT7833896.1 hypothetical protein [Aquabacterium sp. OR-4]
MNLLPKPLRQAFRTSPQAAMVAAVGAATVLQAPALADELAAAEAAARQAAEGLAARGCGWFESSFELRQGLAVSECDAAAWFDWAAATPEALRLEPSSARLQ